LMDGGCVGMGMISEAGKWDWKEKGGIVGMYIYDQEVWVGGTKKPIARAPSHSQHINTSSQPPTSPFALLPIPTLFLLKQPPPHIRSKPPHPIHPHPHAKPPSSRRFRSSSGDSRRRRDVNEIIQVERDPSVCWGLRLTLTLGLGLGLTLGSVVVGGGVV
jgi:hypothetical protein